MLTEICGYLKNWFDGDIYRGSIKVSEGVISCDGEEITIDPGQYFYLAKPDYKLGVYEYGVDELKDREFDGAVCFMDIPDDVLDLAKDITDWMAEYSVVGSPALSPYQSESFGGYSYSKSGGSGDSGLSGSWVNVFGGRLSRHKKI